jgi:putative PIN family toxin of toxin-antitoxin system
VTVFDASTIVGAAIGRNSNPYRALHHAREHAGLALSAPVYREIFEVLHRPRLARFIDAVLRDDVLDLLIAGSHRFDPAVRVTDCRDAKDNIYLELALAAVADSIVSSDKDLLVLHPWRGVKILSPSAYLAIVQGQIM